MKIRYSKLDLEIPIDKNKINFLVLENKDYYYDFIVNTLASESNDDSIVSVIEKDKMIPLGKSGFIIDAPQDLSFESMAYKSELYKYITQNAYDMLEEKYSIVNSLTEELFDELNMNLQFEIDFNEELTFKDFLSAYKVKLINPEVTFLERLIQYIQTLHKLSEKNLFIIANCASFIKLKDYMELLKFVKYEDIDILFVDQQRVALSCEMNECIIDNDLCIIY